MYFNPSSFDFTPENDSKVSVASRDSCFPTEEVPVASVRILAQYLEDSLSVARFLLSRHLRSLSVVGSLLPGTFSLPDFSALAIGGNGQNGENSGVFFYVLTITVRIQLSKRGRFQPEGPDLVGVVRVQPCQTPPEPLGAVSRGFGWGRVFRVGFVSERF